MPPELERRIEALAKEEGASLAQTVIRLLLRATGLRGPDDSGRVRGTRGRNHELDALAGTWNAEQAAEFERALDEQRRIDRELWN